MERTRYNFPDIINLSLGKEFTMIPNILINDPTLSSNAFKIYCILLSNPTGWTTRNKNIYDRVPFGHTSVSNALKELEKKGFIIRIIVRDKISKRRAGSFIAITDVSGLFSINKTAVSHIDSRFELYYKSYIIETHDIGSYNIEPGVYINIINNNKEINNKDSSSVEIEKNGYITRSQFEQFWELYPKKTDKGKTLSKWNTLCGRKDPPKWREIKKALLQQKKTERWEERKYIPNPTTWLHQSRWLDDPDQMTSYIRNDTKKTGTKLHSGMKYGGSTFKTNEYKKP